MSRIKKIELGSQGMTTIANMDIYGKADETEAITTLHQSLELGGNFLRNSDNHFFVGE